METKVKDNTFKDILEQSGIKETISLERRIRNEHSLGMPKEQSKPQPRYKIEPAKDRKDRHMVSALDTYLNTDKTKARFGNYFVDGPELYFRNVISKSGHATLEENLIAAKIPQGEDIIIIGNSAALGLIGYRSNYGHSDYNRGETEVQRRLAQYAPMIPFNVFQDSGLDLKNIRIIERGPEETLERKTGTKYNKATKKDEPVYETLHYTGASLFSCNDSVFLFDIDRREIKHKVFNAFLVKLPKPVKSIKRAYESLIPKRVKDAQSKGLNVRRQGEWFFIPVTDKKTLKILDKAQQNISELETITLSAGNNRPNYAKGFRIIDGKINDLSKMDRSARWDAQRKLEGQGELYLTSKVEHSGREHTDLILKGWYVATPNTAQESWTVEGDID